MEENIQKIRYSVVCRDTRNFSSRWRKIFRISAVSSSVVINAFIQLIIGESIQNLGLPEPSRPGYIVTFWIFWNEFFPTKTFLWPRWTTGRIRTTRITSAATEAHVGSEINQSKLGQFYICYYCRICKVRKNEHSIFRKSEYINHPLVRKTSNFSICHRGMLSKL